MPVIVEKPIGDTVEAATRLVEAGEAAGVPVLTGHHRNYSPIMSKARARSCGAAQLGSVVAVAGTALFYKPDDYFEVGGGWRRQPGGGPILLNLIHEVNNLLSLVGDIVRVQAVTSNATRGYPVEDTAAMMFTFANGALGTFLLSDTAASPRSWEQTSQENALSLERVHGIACSGRGFSSSTCPGRWSGPRIRWSGDCVPLPWKWDGRPVKGARDAVPGQGPVGRSQTRYGDDVWAP